ncbi:MAG: ATP-binding protein [Chromatiales bacterium]|nr:ATP-binding protein [Gammaproteobacteria bacterium]
MGFIEQVYAKRKKLADVLVDEEYSGIREIVEELYPDKAHFIYELLQNAEDTNATYVTFNLDEDRLVFEHNGDSFTEDDVFGITNIGKGTKKDDKEKIGKFGVGFKAVFAYTETPRIWSPTFAFQISDLVLPSGLTVDPELGGITRFEFPFNNNKKNPSDAYAEVLAGLDDISENTLLFLSSIKSIRWEVKNKKDSVVSRFVHTKYHIEMLKIIGDRTVSSSHFLLFMQPAEGLRKQCIAIAFSLGFLSNISEYDPAKELSEQFKIVVLRPGNVAVFFPAEKETSGLNGTYFRINILI